MIDRNVPKVVLDPANDEELVQLTYNRIRAASGGVIDDFRQGSTVSALVEGQVFAISELLYYFNLLPEAIAIEVFRLFGVERSLGTKASGAVTFLLKELSPNGFFLPAGYSIPFLDGNLVLTQDLNIAQDSREGTVNVAADRVGKAYNAEEFGLLVTNSGLGQVQTISNRLPLTGGSDIETLENWVKRSQRLVRSRKALISKQDYEDAAVELMGEGSRAIAVAGLSSDSTSILAGNVGLFLQDSQGKPAAPATIQSIRGQLADRIPLNSRLNIFPVVQEPLSVEVFADSYDLSDSTFTTIIKAILSYLDPTNYRDGRKIRHNEILYRVRQVVGIRAVDTVLINGQAIDYLLPNDWVVPLADNIIVNLIDGDGQTRTSLGGSSIYDDSEGE
jgi:uncharacterized phage protein gp47/JayE